MRKFLKNPLCLMFFVNIWVTYGSSFNNQPVERIDDSFEQEGHGYCIPAALGGSPNQPGREYIISFSTGEGTTNISNLNSGFSPGGYGDFYDTHSVSQAQGEGVTFEAHMTSADQFRIWVDWNQDGVFDPIEELAWFITHHSNITRGMIDVPLDAALGETRMRIVMGRETDPCSTTLGYGEFEDYKFIVEEGVGRGSFPEPYCEVTGIATIEAITKVEFAGINNWSTPDSSIVHDDFIRKEGYVFQGQTYDLLVKGYTPYNETSYYTAWFDWNQDGIFDEETERYDIGTIRFSHGMDYKSAEIPIDVPPDALQGPTRMRVMKRNYAYPENSCYIGVLRIKGQAEDYTVVVSAPFDFIYHDDITGWTPHSPGDELNPSNPQSRILIAGGRAVFDTDIIAGDLTVRPGAVLEIENVLKLNGRLHNRGRIEFKSSTTGTGQFDEFDGTISGEGEFVTERFIPAKRSFRFLSSAVTGGSIRENWQENGRNDPGLGTHITGDGGEVNGFDPTQTNNPSMFVLETDGNTQTWVSVPDTNNTPLEAGTPYRMMVRGDRTIDLSTNTPPPTPTVIRSKGVLKTGNHVVEGTPLTAGQYFFVGNPYQASVDISLLLDESSHINKNFYYLWDPQLSSANGRGAYTTVDLQTGMSNNGSDANQYLQPGQAILVKSLGGVPRVEFKETQKRVDQPLTSTFLIPPSGVALQLFYEDAYHQNDTPSDGLRINFFEDGNSGIDPFDAPKMGNLDENIATLTRNKYFSIERRAFPEDGEVISLFINNYRQSDYVFKGQFFHEDEGIQAFLVDKYLGIQTELVRNEEVIYAFEVEQGVQPSMSSSRFELYFQVEPVLHTQDFLLSGFEIYPNPVTDSGFNIYAKEMAGKSFQLEIMNIIGQRMFSDRLVLSPEGTAHISPEIRLPSGIYVLKITSEDGRVWSKKLIKN